MGKWSAVLNFGGKMINNPATRSFGRAVIHPQRTLTGMGAAVKTAAIGGGTGYVMWEALVNDKPVVRTVSDAVIGHDNVDKIVGKTGEVVDTVTTTARTATDTLTGISDGVNGSRGFFDGISDFMRDMSGGNGTNMFSNLFSNLTHGNVSGLSIVGLLAAGMMIFGRFGFLAKIAGALLAMMLIGNNSRQVTPQVATPEEPQRSGGMKR